MTVVSSTVRFRLTYDRLRAGDEGGGEGLEGNRSLESIGDALPLLKYLGETQLRDSINVNQIISIRLINVIHGSCHVSLQYRLVHHILHQTAYVIICTPAPAPVPVTATITEITGKVNTRKLPSNFLNSF